MMHHLLKSSLLSIFLIQSISSNSQNKLDSLTKLLSITSDTTHSDVLNILAFELIYSRPSESERLALEDISYCEDIGYHKGKARAYSILGISHDLRGNYSTAVECYKKGIDVLTNESFKLNNKDLHSSLLNGLGLAYYHQSKYNEALTYFFQALKLLENSENIIRLGNLNNNIGLVYHDLKEFDKAIEYYKTAFQLAEKIGSKVMAGRATNNIGLIYSAKQDHELAIKYYNLSLGFKKNLNDENGLSATYLNLGVIYKRIGEYSKALDYLNESEKIKIKLDDKLGILNVTDTKIEILIKQSRFEEAEQLALENLSRVNHLKTIEPRILVYERFYDLYKSQNRYKESLVWHEKIGHLKDSLFNARTIQQALEIETRFETEKKEQTILLLEREKRTQTIWKYIWISGALGLGLGILSIVRLQKQRNRKARQLIEMEKALNEQLKETDNIKSRFFANISHEFRTPLSLIIAPLDEKLQSQYLRDEDKADLRLVKRNANRLLVLVNQILDLSKIEAGKMKLHIKSRDLTGFLSVLVASFDSLAESKEIKFIASINTPSISYKYDEDKIEKIISNLLSNAFKFTPVGGSISLNVEDVDNGTGLSIKVEDTGEGILPEDLPHIFSPFFQSKYVESNSQLGSGLGLALVAELVKLHNGRIAVTSNVNKGTSFSIWISIERDNINIVSLEPHIKYLTLENEDEPYQKMPALQQTNGEFETILLVEDNIELNSFISNQLMNQFKVISTKNGKEGLEWAQTHLPDIIISDVMMPEMNGVELTQAIRSDERTDHIPIILLSAKADIDSRLYGFEIGADDYISKPFSTRELHIRINNILSSRKLLADKYKKLILETQSESPIQILEPSLNDKFLVRLRTAITENLSDSSYGIEKLADEMCLSRAQLFRKVKAITGLSPSEIVTDMRLNRAAELIKAKSDTLTQISYSVGFNDQSYFSKRFRKKFGMNPTEYSEQNRQV